MKNSLLELNNLITQTTQIEEEALPSLDSFITSLHEVASKINCLAINTAIIVEQAHVKHEGLQVIASEMQMLGEQTEFTLEQMKKKMHELALALKHHHEKLQQMKEMMTNTMKS